MRQRGFTLLEMMVATLIMGIAVVGLMSAITSSLRNITRVTTRDRAVLLARSKMDELLIDASLPRDSVVQGNFNPVMTGGVEGGWRAHLTTVDVPPGVHPGDQVLDRLELEIWWMGDNQRRTFVVNGYRARLIRPGDMP